MAQYQGIERRTECLPVRTAMLPHLAIGPKYDASAGRAEFLWLAHPYTDLCGLPGADFSASATPLMKAIAVGSTIEAERMRCVTGSVPGGGTPCSARALAALISWRRAITMPRSVATS